MTKHVSPKALLCGSTALTLPFRGTTKVKADVTNPQAAVGELNKAWTEFMAKYNTDQKDVVRQEEVTRINSAVGVLQASVDDINTKLAARLSVTTKREPLPGADPEYRKLYSQYFRSGNDEQQIKSRHNVGPRAAYSVGSNPDGGFTAPVEWDRQIEDSLKLVSPMRQICTVRQVGSSTPTRLWNLRGTASGWVGEATARPQTNSSQFGTITFPMGQIYAMPSATQDLLDDSLVDIENWLFSEVDIEFAQKEGTAVVLGSGVAQPKGLLLYATAQPEHPGGAIPKQTIAGGALTGDSVLNTVYDLPSMFLADAKFIMNRNTHGKVRTLKDNTGQYLWQPSYAAGQPATLSGYPLVEVPDMPNAAVNAYPLAFGDFKRGYHIIDRVGTRILRDPYTLKPYVLFYVTKRVGGGVANPQCMRLLQVIA
jgi:HK97 family phage major capsid protein